MQLSAKEKKRIWYRKHKGYDLPETKEEVFKRTVGNIRFEYDLQTAVAFERYACLQRLDKPILSVPFTDYYNQLSCEERSKITVITLSND